MLAILLESTENSLHTFLDADESRKNRMRQPLLQVSKEAVRWVRCGERAAVSFMQGGGLRLIGLMGRPIRSGN